MLEAGLLVVIMDKTRRQKHLQPQKASSQTWTPSKNKEKKK